jgi:hypothetical protein
MAFSGLLKILTTALMTNIESADLPHCETYNHLFVFFGAFRAGHENILPS